MEEKELCPMEIAQNLPHFRDTKGLSSVPFLDSPIPSDFLLAVPFWTVASSVTGDKPTSLNSHLFPE
jgi:hypothetical protein